MKRMASNLIPALAVAATLAVQTPSAMAQQVPSVKLLTAPLVTPGNAWAYYDSRPDINTPPTQGVANWGTHGTPPELLELARALGANRTGDADYARNYTIKVYEYVRNNIATEFRFELAKGARGAVIDQSGTPFDQAHLMVTLLRLGNVTAGYEVGEISLTAQQFGKWTGLITGWQESTQTFSVNKRAACQFLADGGIPATVSGESSCSNLSGNLATNETVNIGHIWVTANGKRYDPSFKLHHLKGGVDLALAMGCGSDANQSCGSTILTKTGDLDASGTILAGDTERQGRIDDQMNTYAEALQSKIQELNANSKTTLLVEDIVGGKVIDTSAPYATDETQPIAPPGSALPDSTPEAHYAWSGNIPNPFRITLQVRIDSIDTTLYVDEYYGQRLRIFQDTTDDQYSSTTRRLTLYLETRPVSLRSTHAISPSTANAYIYLDVNHPYAAANGSYADDAVSQLIVGLTINSYDACVQSRQLYSDLNLSGCLPGTLWYTNVLSVVQFWGDSSQSSIAHYGALQQRDNVALAASDADNSSHIWPVWNFDPGVQGEPVGALDACMTALSTGTSVSAQPRVNPGCREEHQAVLAATWAAQTSRAWYLASQINRGAVQQHHHLGVVVSGKAVETNRVSIQSALSANSSGANGAVRTALFASGTQVMNRLEGSVIEQMFDAWEGGSSSSLLVRSNRRGIAFRQLSSSTDLNNLTSYTTGQLQTFGNYLAAAQGYTLIVPQVGLHEEEAQPCLTNRINGVCQTSRPFRYPFTGMMAENASTDAIALTGAFETKGAGFVTSPDPAKSALDAVKVGNYSAKARNYFGVNLQSGDLTLTPPADLTTGTGAFPMSLSFQRTYSSANSIDAKDCTSKFNGGNLSGYTQAEPEYRPADLGGGWSNNWSIYSRAGSDGLAGLGRDSAINAAGAIAGLYVTGKLNAGTRTMRERLATVFANNGWVQNLQNNIVTIRRGNSTSVFVRRLGGSSFNAPVGVNEQLTQTGSREVITKGIPFLGSNYAKWDFTPITYDLLMADGSTMHFVFGRNTLDTQQRRSVGYWVPSAWTFTTGVNLAFEYTNQQIGGVIYPGEVDFTGVPFPGMPGYTAFTTGDYTSYACLSSVSNNLGRSLHFDCTYLLSAVSDENERTVRFRSETAAASDGGTDGIHNAAPLCRPSKMYVTAADESSVTRYEYAAKPTTAIERDYPKITRWFTASDSANPFRVVNYDSLYRVKEITDNDIPTPRTTSYFSTGLYGSENHKRGEVLDPLGALTANHYDDSNNLIAVIDPLARATYHSYDSSNRRTRTTFPEENSISYTYDARHNKLTETAHPKPNSALPVNTTTYTYVEGATVGTCVTQATCNQVASVTDPKGNVTNYAYLGSGLLQRATGPLVAPVAPNTTADRAQVDYCYGAYGLLAASITKVDASTTRVNSYTYDAANKFVLSSSIVDPGNTYVAGALGNPCTTTSKSGALNLTTEYNFDAIGNLASVDGPRAGGGDTTSYLFDKTRRVTTISAPLSALTRYCYDADGLLVSTNRARSSTTDPYADTAQSTGQCATAFNTDLWQSETRTYFPTGDLKSTIDAEGNVTRYAYDAVGRQRVVQDPDGRQTATVYDPAGQVTAIWKGGVSWIDGNGFPSGAPGLNTAPPSSYNGSGLFRYSYTPSESVSGYTASTSAYSPNGKLLWQQDANNNRTDYQYDKHDRLWRTYFPHPIAGTRCTPNATEWQSGSEPIPGCSTDQTYERLLYTDNGMTGGTRCSGDPGKSCQLLNRRGQTIAYTYDTMNRLGTKAPDGQGTVTTAYNLAGDIRRVSEPALGSFAAYQTDYDYDAAGRKGNEQYTSGSTVRNVTYQYDEAGNRTRTTWPDNYYISYEYDALNRMSYVRENAANTELAHYEYDPLSRRTLLCLGGGTCSVDTGTHKVRYTYEADSNLDLLNHHLASTGPAISLDYGHNHSGQITTIQASDEFYLSSKPNGAATQVYAYTPDSLNRYRFLTFSGTDLNPTYDNSGNLLSWQSPAKNYALQTYTYDSENRLVTINAPNISYDYDALGRRVKKTVGTTATQYLLDGDEEIAEYSGSTLLHRYITGPAIDDRIMHIDYVNGGLKTFYHTNHQGSVVAMTDSVGNLTGTNCGSLCTRLAYDEYGKLTSGGSTSGEAFRYTGRRYDDESGLYYYRARYYSPDLGRFLQVDPIGYRDDLNLYAYVGNDPSNRTDPSGNLAVADDAIVVAAAVAITAYTACVSYCDDVAEAIGDAATATGEAIAAAHQMIVTGVVDAAENIKTTMESRSRAPGPDPDAEGRPHSVPDAKGGYTTHGPRDPKTGKPESEKQFRPTGKPHGDIPRPNVKERPATTRPDGSRAPGKPTVRPPRPEEIRKPPPPQDPV